MRGNGAVAVEPSPRSLPSKRPPFAWLVKPSDSLRLGSPEKGTEGMRQLTSARPHSALGFAVRYDGVLALVAPGMC
jgi:hypothetical protein